MIKTSRRAFVGLAAAAGAPWPRAARAQSGRPVRIGCLTALTGAQEVIGRPILTGAEIAADQINMQGGILGRRVEIVAADVHADPVTAVSEAKRLMKDGINLFCGCVTSDVALAVAPLMQPGNAVLVTCSAQTDKLTHEAFTPNVFRVTDQTFMRQRAQARLMAERYPEVTNWAAIIPDVEYGRSAYAAFRDGLQEYYPALAKQDAVIAEPILATFGATDFRPQLRQLRDSGAEGLFVAVYGGDAAGLYRQAKLAGLMTQFRVLADSYNEFLVPMELGASTPDNLWLAMTWYYGGYLDTPMGRALYDANLLRTGNGMPLGFLDSGHAAVYAYAAGATKARRFDTKPMIAALEGLSFDTAKGRVTFRKQDHQAICDVNFIRIKGSDVEPTLDALDYLRPDIDVAEFVRYDGATVIEPATPGQVVAYRAK